MTVEERLDALQRALLTLIALLRDEARSSQTSVLISRLDELTSRLTEFART